MVRLKIHIVAPQQGFSRSSLSRLANISISTVRDAWNNPHYDIGLHTLAKIAQTLQVSVCDLIDESDEDAKSAPPGAHNDES